MFYLVVNLPSMGGDDDETFQKILNSPLEFRSKIFASVSQAAKDLIKCLLDKNPDTRLSAEQAMSHPWFKKF